MKRAVLSLLAGSMLLGLGVTGCGPALESGVESGDLAASVEADIDNQVLNSEVSQTASSLEDPSTTDSQTAAPQLIKRAALVLSVESVEESFEEIERILTAQQGDVLYMDDSGDRQRRISSELRVPQQNLDATLAAFGEVGTVRSRTITTEDVSSQLVDLQARLSNARKQEEALQEIMSRSGEISDVLEVSKELSSVRERIEQMAAAQKNLQTQVRYSTIDLTISSTAIAAPEKPAFTRQLANSWEAATSSVGDFTTDLLQLGLWLLAYSPYIFVMLCGAVAARKVVRRLSTSRS